MTTPPRIINLVDMEPNKRGPVELQLLATARQATATGFDYASYFTKPVPDWFADEMAAAGGRIGSFNREQWLTSIVGVARREQPDIVHFHFGHHAGMTEVAKLGAKVIRTEHSPAPPRELERARSLIRHWRTRRVTLFICVSEFIAQQTVTHFRVSRSRIRVVLNATDIDRFRPRPAERLSLRRDLLGVTDDRIIIVIAAHLRPSKRQALAISAMPEILQAAPSTRLVLAGDGPDRDALLGLVARENLNDVVMTLFGDNDVAALYAASDIALLPSTGEGLPGSGIEALACGLPLVATPCGGTPELYEDGVSGVSVFDQTAHGIAQALLPLVTQSSLRQSMGRAARQRAESMFAITRPAQETLDIYHEGIGR